MGCALFISKYDNSRKKVDLSLITSCIRISVSPTITMKVALLPTVLFSPEEINNNQYKDNVEVHAIGN